MKASIIKRLEVIEAQYRDDPLIVLVITDSGEEKKMTMRELVTEKWDEVTFKKIIGGKCLKDLQLLLDKTREEAEKAILEYGEEGGTEE